MAGDADLSTKVAGRIARANSRRNNRLRAGRAAARAHAREIRRRGRRSAKLLTPRIKLLELPPLARLKTVRQFPAVAIFVSQCGVRATIADVIHFLRTAKTRERSGDLAQGSRRKSSCRSGWVRVSRHCNRRGDRIDRNLRRCFLTPHFDPSGASLNERVFRSRRRDRANSSEMPQQQIRPVFRCGFFVEIREVELYRSLRGA